MATTETSGNPTVTDSDLTARVDHLDEGIHEIQRILHEILTILQPLRDHPEAVAKGLALLDPGAMTRKFLGKKTKG